MQAENILTYWCYSCEKYSKQNTEAEACQHCHSEAIELADNNHNDPSAFQPFEIQNTPTQPQTASGSSNQPTGQNSAANQMPIPPLIQTMNFGPIQIGFGTGVMNGQNHNNIIQMNIDLQSMGNMIQSVQSIFQGTGLNQLLNSLVGQSNLVPMTPQEIQRLQKITVSSECTICQQEGGEKLGYKLRCGHEFHIECLNPWFQRTNTCPTCRQRI